MSLLRKVKYEICDWVGHVLCEFSFRLWDLFDKPYDEWRWWNHAIYQVGRPTYTAGCFFYSLNDCELGDVVLELSDGCGADGECSRCAEPCCPDCGVCEPCFYEDEDE